MSLALQTARRRLWRLGTFWQGGGGEQRLLRWRQGHQQLHHTPTNTNDEQQGNKGSLEPKIVEAEAHRSELATARRTRWRSGRAQGRRQREWFLRNKAVRAGSRAAQGRGEHGGALKLTKDGLVAVACAGGARCWRRQRREKEEDGGQRWALKARQSCYGLPAAARTRIRCRPRVQALETPRRTPAVTKQASCLPDLL
jgi:hypothetical protein